MSTSVEENGDDASSSNDIAFISRIILQQQQQRSSSSLLVPVGYEISSIAVVNDIVQANAHGKIISIVSVASDECPSLAHHATEIFCKTVSAATYAASKKTWNDLRRTLIYARTEARFYSEFLPPLRRRCGLPSWNIAPECLHASCDLNGLVEENEPADLPQGAVSTGLPSLSQLAGRGGRIVLSSISDHDQESPLDPLRVAACLESLASFHAASVGDHELLSSASQRLSRHGGSYHLLVRNPTELEKMEVGWKQFAQEFADVAPPGFFESDRMLSFGRRMKYMASWISHQISPLPHDPFATIVHGDAKAMNMFLPPPQKANGALGSPSMLPLLIDFASTGIGFGMSDVAMFITHAVKPSDLRDGGEKQLVDGYVKQFRTALHQQKNCRSSIKNNTDGSMEYLFPDDVATRQYKLACVDYCRFVLGRFWAKASPASFAKSANNRNVVLVNRNWDAAEYFIQKIDGYLADFETERGAEYVDQVL